MANNSKKRTNWTDKQRTVTGVVTTIVVVVLVLLCVVGLGKKKPATVVSAPVASAPVASAPATTPAKAEAASSPAPVAAPAPAPVATAPAKAEPTKVETAPAAPVVETPKTEVPTVVAEPVKAEVAVVEPAKVEEVKVSEVAPVAEVVVVEAVVEEVPVTEVVAVVEAAAPAVEAAPVEAAPVEAPLFAQAYTYMGYNASVTAYADHAVVTCDYPFTVADVKAIAGMLVEAYPEAAYVTYELGDGCMVAYYPAVDGAYLEAVAKQLQSDAMWYLAKLMAPVEEPAPVEVPVVAVAEALATVEAPVAAPVEEMEPAVVEERLFTSFVFDVFGYSVYGEIDGPAFLSVVDSEMVTADDIEAFCDYEFVKYPFLTEFPGVIYADGIGFEVPEGIDARDYIDVYQAEIYAYVCQLLNIEMPTDVKPATIQNTPYCIYTFDVYGHDIEGAYTADAFSSITTEDGIVSEADIEGFVAYAVAKYPFLYESVAIEIIPDGFILDLRVPADAGDYLDLYKAEILAYVNQLFAPKAEVVAPVEEAPVVEVAPVEETKVNTYSFSVFGYGVQGAYADGCFTSESATKGLLTDADIMGFVGYENAKYGAFLTDNVLIALQDDGFVLTIPTGIDAGAYLDEYQADIIEYVNTLFAPVAAPVEETPAAVVETAPVEEAPVVAVVEEPAPAADAVVPAKIDSVEVVVVTDGSEKVAPASPVAEKVKYNNFKVELSLKGGAYAEAKNELSKYALMGGIAVDFKNALDFGTRVGFGARLNANATVRPTTGWKNAFNDFNIRNFNSEIAASADLMFYANFNRATMYAGAGAGYCITRNIEPTVSDTVTLAGHSLKGGLFIEGTAGMSVELTESFGMGLDLGYRYYPSTAKSSVNGGLTLNFIF